MAVLSVGFKDSNGSIGGGHGQTQIFFFFGGGGGWGG